MTALLGAERFGLRVRLRASRPPAQAARMRHLILLVLAVLGLSAAAATPVKPPASPAGEKLGWFLELMNQRHGQLDAAEAQRILAEPFLAQVPAAQFVAIAHQLGSGLAPFRLEAVHEQSPLALVARADSQQGPVAISVGVAPDSHRVQGLLVRPAPPPGPKPGSWQAVEDALGQLAPEHGLLLARVDASACAPIESLAPERALAIGSSFKLYVLLAAAKKIDAGKLAWDTPIAVREDWKSLPSGTLQDTPAGTKLPLRQVAQQMIAISDNTAADHLLRTVGRSEVEQALRDSGHRAPDRDVPFLTTRELFQLKLAASAKERQRYLALPVKRRRAFLAKLDHEPLPALASAKGWDAPREIDRLEWFASPSDLCRAMAAIRQEAHADPSAPVLQILSKNPGVPPEPGAFSYVGFKGGSEPGVMNLTWLLQRKADQSWWVLSLGANDPKAAIDETKMIAIAQGALALAAQAH